MGTKIDIVSLNNDVLAIGRMLNNDETAKLKHICEHWTMEYKKVVYSQLFGEKADKFASLFLTIQ